MPKLLLVEEFHLSFLTPDTLSGQEREAIRAALDLAEFRADLQRAVADLLASYPELALVRVRVGR